MTLLDLRRILLLCCSLQLGRMKYFPFPVLCPPEFPHQLGSSLCLSINEKDLTFQEAQASCDAKGGKLVEPRTYKQDLFLYFKVQPNNNQLHGYWIGITDSAANGNWTYASDNSRITSSLLAIEFDDLPPEGHNCMMSKLQFKEFAPCEQKARSVCQYDLPVKVCGVREGGDLFTFHSEWSNQYLRMPCDYTLASIVCGDYDVRVYGTSGLVKAGVFSPQAARVVVQRALTQETLVSAQVSRKAIAKSIDGKNLWTVTDGEWSTEVSEAFEPARKAAVIKIGDVGQVDFSATKDKVESGLYVRCKDVRSSVEFPGSFCGDMAYTSNWTRALGNSRTFTEQLQVIMRVIFLQNAGKQLQCSEIANKARSCPDEEAAVRTCAPVFIDSALTKCFEGDKVWFDRCLDADCNKNVDTCRELKTKMADCGITFIWIPKELTSFMALLDTC